MDLLSVLGLICPAPLVSAESKMVRIDCFADTLAESDEEFLGK